MQWSKLRKNIYNFWPINVQKRIQLHTTKYRSFHDHDGRSWITIDGEEIVNMPHVWKWLEAMHQRQEKLRKETGATTGVDFSSVARQQLHQEGIFFQSDLPNAMFEYLSMSIDDILQSEEIIINALGLLDKRVGKRRLRNVDIKALHPIAQAFYWVRCESENIKIT